MMTPNDMDILEAQFSQRYEGEYGKIYTANEQNVIICEITKPYVPIDGFMALLKEKAKHIEDFGCDKFIFDKRELRGFHQPSMEWYYLTWKPEMYQKYGLAVHRKLFTTEDWFRKCIQAGRAEIKRKDPGSIVHTLDIQVKESLHAAFYE